MSYGNGKPAGRDDASPRDTAVQPSTAADTERTAALPTDSSVGPAAGEVVADPAALWDGETTATTPPNLGLDDGSAWDGTTLQDAHQPSTVPPPESEDEGRATVQMKAVTPERDGRAKQPTIRLQPPAPDLTPVAPVDGEERLDTAYGELLLGDRIGRGGMAEVFLAERRGPQGFSQKVVVKRMLPAFAEDATFVRRFVLEASLAAKLRHPNVIEILDLGTHDGEYYIVMEYLDGMTVAAVVRRLVDIGLPVQPGIIANVGARIADALSYAHTFVDLDGTSHRVVHRDVSPENIMLTRDGRVKLLDFGVAKDLDVEGLTIAGDVVGKPLYLPPEAYRGDTPSPAWDIYALGIVLYTLLAGEAPYTLRSGPAGLIDLIDDVMQVEPPRLDTVNTLVAKPLSDIVMRAIAGSTEDRYATAAALRDDLDAFVATLPGYAQTDPTTMLRDIGEAMAQADDGPAPPWKQPGPKAPRKKAEREQVERAARRREAAAAAPAQTPMRWPLLAAAFMAVAAAAGGLGFWWANRKPREAVRAPTANEFTIPAPAKPAVVTTGTISIVCRSWGYLYIDGVSVGMCPTKPHEVKPGRHVVVFKGRSKTRKRRVEVQLGRNVVADFTAPPAGRVYTIRPGE